MTIIVSTGSGDEAVRVRTSTIEPNVTYLDLVTVDPTSGDVEVEDHASLVLTTVAARRALAAALLNG